MRIIRKLFFLVLVISPLLSITGSNDYSTGLNLAALLNVPSLNPLNYVFLILFFFVFVILNINKSIQNLRVGVCFFLVFLIVFYRHPSLFSFVGLISIYSCFLIFMDDKVGLTNIGQKGQRYLFGIYVFYIILSVITHLVLLRSENYYANDRMMGIFKNPNQLAFFLVAIYLLYILKIRKNHNLFSTLLFPFIILLLVVMTGSRSALLTMLLIYFTNQFIRKKWGYIIVLVLFALTLTVLLFEYAGVKATLELVSRRSTDTIEEAGNMRFQIFKEIFETHSLLEILIGKDVSIGTSAMTYEQRETGGSVIWLDNLVNVLAYNWGVLGLLLYVFFIFIQACKSRAVVNDRTLVMILYLVGSFFFVMADFFPLAFLIVYLKNDFECH